MLGYKLWDHERQWFWQVFLICIWMDCVLWAHNISLNSSMPISRLASNMDTNTDTTTLTAALALIQFHHPFTSTDALEPLEYSRVQEILKEVEGDRVCQSPPAFKEVMDWYSECR